MEIYFQTIHHIRVALGAFELERGMADVVFLEQHIVDCLLDERALADITNPSTLSLNRDNGFDCAGTTS